MLGELFLGGAYSDSVFRSNSDFSDLYTSVKDVFNVINLHLLFTGTVSASTPLSTQIIFVFVILPKTKTLVVWAGET